jgi:hypothetical protein
MRIKMFAPRSRLFLIRKEVDERREKEKQMRDCVP